MVLNPAIFFSLIWVFQIFGYFFFSDSFGSYSIETFFVIGLGWAAFLLGCFLAETQAARTFSKPAMPYLNVMTFPGKINLKVLATLFCIIFSVLGIFLAIYLFYRIQAFAGEPFKSFTHIRDLIVRDFERNRLFYNYFRFYHFGFIAVIFLFCFGKALSRGLLIALFCVGLASVVLTTSRLFLLFYVLSILGILVSFRKINSKQIFLAGIGFFVLFFGLSIAMKKGYSNFDKPLLLLKWNLQVYLFSPLAAFNSFVVSGVPSFESIVIIPNTFKKLLNYLGGTFDLRTNIMPFVYVPVRTNVFTFFFPLYHDGGKILVAFGCAALGFLHQTLYVWARTRPSPVIVYLFSLSLYPLGLSFFEDAYFSSPGFLLLQLSPVLLLTGLNFDKLFKLYRGTKP